MLPIRIFDKEGNIRFTVYTKSQLKFLEELSSYDLWEGKNWKALINSIVKNEEFQDGKNENEEQKLLSFMSVLMSQKLLFNGTGRKGYIMQNLYLDITLILLIRQLMTEGQDKCDYDEIIERFTYKGHGEYRTIERLSEHPSFSRFRDELGQYNRIDPAEGLKGRNTYSGGISEGMAIYTELYPHLLSAEITLPESPENRIESREKPKTKIIKTNIIVA